MRSIEQPNEADIAASTPRPQTPIKGRVPLGEVAGNKGIEIESADSSEGQAVPAKKGPGRGKKGNTSKKANKQTREKTQEVRVEVLEDENQSTNSSAAEEACHDLFKDSSQGTHQLVIDNDRSQTPPSAAASTASRQLSPQPTTPHNHEMQERDNMTMAKSKDENDDSFIAKIESRTPLGMKTSEHDILPTEDDNKDDSFVEQIKTRTPGKRVSRIEDSVEALDALEEEIEKVGGLIPASTDTAQFSGRAKKHARPQSTSTDKKVGGSERIKKSTGVQKRSAAGRPNTAPVPATSNPLTGSTKTEARPRTSPTQEKPEVTVQNSVLIRMTSQPASQATLKKRISSVHKAPFQPHKSTKPPTRANFELPGDAFARKLKEQREERLKREEEEMPKPRVFKARPVRLSRAPEVKLTAATKARLSMAKGEPVSIRKPPMDIAKSKPATRCGTMATTSPSKRLSTISVAKCSSQSTADGLTQPPTNGSIRVTRGPSINPLNVARAPSAFGANRPALTAEENAHQKLKGKEVFGRTKIEIMERERTKKEKEDAARKARAEAAERGRIASREWAEKQKARKLEAGKVKGQGQDAEL